MLTVDSCLPSLTNGPGRNRATSAIISSKAVWLQTFDQIFRAAIRWKTAVVSGALQHVEVSFLVIQRNGGDIQSGGSPFFSRRLLINLQRPVDDGQRTQNREEVELPARHIPRRFYQTG